MIAEALKGPPDPPKMCLPCGGSRKGALENPKKM